MDVGQGGPRLVAFAQQDDALDDFVVVLPNTASLGVANVAVLVVAHRDAPHHASEAGLMAHHHAFLVRQRSGPQRSAFNHVVDAHRHVVRGAQHNLPDFSDAAFFLRAEVIARGDGVFHAHRGFDRVLAHSQHAQRADHVSGAAVYDVVTPDIGIVRGDSILKLLQSNAVTLHPRGSGWIS